MKHPHGYSDDEQAFISAARRGPTEIPAEDFDRLNDLLGRFPTYEVVDGAFDYDKPIVINQRFMDSKLADQGFENVLLGGRPLTIREAE